MFNAAKKVETVEDWCEAVITDFHDRSASSLSHLYSVEPFEEHRDSKFRSKYHRAVVILFLIELSGQLSKTKVKEVDIRALRQKIISIYGSGFLDEMDYVDGYAQRLSRLKNLKPDVAAILVTHGIDYGVIDDFKHPYSDLYSFVRQTADDLQDYFLAHIVSHVKWAIKEGGLEDVR